ncbi:G1/S-specific cyclin-D1 [Galdieria sulphuraria]|uniref:Mitotic-specific cyclin n=1 Tax=Galdieria sulphuraria TaxID=130081 RepID=M2XAK0_GALSU|nr:mitotic-specific cyclin [Galdieria sulphuraria]EME26897.1 mitotic-specific cyclin [Galdieria sulphuraria]GJD10636.1 G1/S-specific cyclin-D1 [Galdieria sulphuraria]|eukprot:XP_005703417.1 mitotic-specific cyclin [Galdieria sulphuraria]
MDEKFRNRSTGEFATSHRCLNIECGCVKKVNSKKRNNCNESNPRLKRIALNDITNFSRSPAKFRSNDNAVYEQAEISFCQQVSSKATRNDDNAKLLSVFGRWIQKDGALPRPDYFEVVQKSKQGPFTREMVAKWFFRVVEDLKLSYNTAFLAIGYFDRFLSKVKVKIQFIPVLSRACLFVAAKFMECNPPSSKQLLCRSKLGFGDELCLLLKFEILLLQVLKWELAIPSAYDILCACIEYFQANDNCWAVHASTLLQIYITEYSMLRLSPSTLAVCSVAMALRRKQFRSAFVEDGSFSKASLTSEIEKISVILNVKPTQLDEFESLLKTVSRKILRNNDLDESITSPTSITDTANSIEREK